jgi:4,5-DOPA dioxygenase extradiol
MDPGRRLLLKILPLLPVAPQALAAPLKPKRMPVLFIGHGSPMNALRDTDYARVLGMLGQRLPKPRAVLVISAHWQTDWITAVQANAQPETIHDFFGFPAELDNMQYPAPGAPEIAARARELLGDAAKLDSRGFDHGAWTVLKRMYPMANVPVLQISIDMMQLGPYHWAMGKALSVLREEGVLIIGSGNVVHNLRMTDSSLPDDQVASQGWAQRFDDTIAALLSRRDDRHLAALSSLPYAQDAMPTADHYWPLIYALGAAYNEAAPMTLFSGFQAGTISMRCLLFGTMPRM